MRFQRRKQRFVIRFYLQLICSLLSKYMHFQQMLGKFLSHRHQASVNEQKFE